MTTYYYLPLEKGMDFIWINLISLYLWTLCAKFSWNWANGSGKEDFFRVVDVFLLCRYNFPFKKSMDFNWLNWNSQHLTRLSAKLSWTGLVLFWGKKMKMWTDSNNENDTKPKEDDRQRKNFNQKSSLKDHRRHYTRENQLYL